MTTPLHICRSCRGIPETAHKTNAEGQRWTIACTKCDRRVTSVTSYEDAKTQWNGDGVVPPLNKAKLRFSYVRRAHGEKLT